MHDLQQGFEQQLLTGVAPPDLYHFNNFTAGDNLQLVSTLQALVRGNQENFIYLWGATGLGKSHLLQACCQYASELKRQSIYIPLRSLTAYTADLLDDLERFDIVCLDDIDSVVQHARWQEAIFHLYNRLRANNKCLVVSALVAPMQLAITLPDLKSRLAAGVCFQVKVLSDDQKISALMNHATRRGMKLTAPLATFMVRHYSRDMARLIELLIVLDQKSLQHSRVLTIPFIKSILEAG